MTKETFTKKCAESKELGLWQETAKIAIQTNRVDLYIQHWIDQYLDKGSRHSVKNTLTPELLEALKLFVCDDVMGEDHSMQLRLIAKTRKIAELKKMIEQLKRQVKGYNK